ncbi:MAG: cell wall hydrolase [Firmicutes bacterium]|nr:cell wall hydrolase [Bacillota bacterium]
MTGRFVVIHITRRRICVGILVLVLLGVLAFYADQRHLLPAQTALREMISGQLIVIDPGHGGYDPGAVSIYGALEKDIVLDIAQHLKVFLNQASVFTILTREADDSADSSADVLLTRKRQDLLERVDLANQAKADLFISIHCNSFPQSIWSGAQVFYYPGREESKLLATAIQTELVARLGPNRRKANAGDYRVIKDTHMPAVVVEVGFLSNPKEAKLLAEPDYQIRVAEAIYHGILRYYRSKSSKILKR